MKIEKKEAPVFDPQRRGKSKRHKSLLISHPGTKFLPSLHKLHCIDILAIAIVNGQDKRDR